MSIILNALRKSEQERQVQQPEILENRILEKQDTVQKKNPVWLISLVFINIFLIIFFFWPFTTEDISEVVERKTVIAEKLEIKAEKTVKTLPLQPVEPVITKEQVSIAEQLKEKQVSKDKKDYEKPKLLKENTASNDKKEKPESDSKKTQRVNLKKKAVTTTALVEEPLLEMVPEKIDSDAQQENAPPFLSELDYDFRRIVPEIDINVFVYSETKEERFIMIDMKKYLSGQQIDAGMKLKEIRLNSIVVEYKNRVFQIKRH